MPGTTKHLGKPLTHLQHLSCDGRKWDMGPVARAIFDTLCAHPYGVPGRKLAELVYASRADGGPEWSLNCITVRICHMNKRWEAAGTGLRIRCRGHWGYQIWIVR